MESTRIDRKLTAILSADVKGYSRLMREDEVATIRTLIAYRELMTSIIQQYRGRVVDAPGDNLLADFGSVVDAVTCAVEVQRELAKRNEELPDQRKMEFRIGINLGDVVIEGERIYGDGVNIAARMEGLAEGGGICISGTVYDQVKNKLDVGFVDLGEQTVKNISTPVRAYHIRTDSPTSSPRLTAQRKSSPDKPTIAVLPFVNMSADPEQGFFADGLTEDIITELARFPNLFVIARNSTFTYKDKPTRVQDVGRELGAHYVVEGSVRRASDRLRLTVQLVNAADGTHIWANRYDRKFTDIFDLHDELTQAIVSTLSGRLEHAVIERVKRKPPEDMAAYDYLLRGKHLHHQRTRETNEEALRVLNKAIELDPEYASAYAWRACTFGQAMAMGWGDPQELQRRAGESVRTGLSLDENDIECRRIQCEVYMEQRNWDQAELHHERAIALNPNDPRIVAQRGELLTWIGRPEEGTECVERAMRLDPFNASAYAHLLGRALYSCRRYEEAVRAYSLISSPRYGHVADMAACCAQSGDVDGAKEKVAQVLAMNPEFSVDTYVENLRYKRESDRDHHREGLRKAALP
jgi:adenylate cyclase